MVAFSLTRTTIDVRRRILTLLLMGEPLSRAELARRTRLNKPTISNVISRMLDEGIVREIGSGVSTGGRKPILLSIRDESRLAIGIEIDDDTCRMVLVDLRGGVLARTEVAPRSNGVGDTIDAIATGIDTLCSPDHRCLVLGCGVAIPGLVNPTDDTVDCHSGLGWNNVPLRSRLADRIGIPVLVTDRGKAAGLGEMWRLGKEQAHDLIYLYLGSGVAGAILLGDEIHWGVSNSAGEIGHMTVDPDGPRCACGNLGCLEALVSIPAILRRLDGERSFSLNQTLTDVDISGVPSHEAIALIGWRAASNDPLALRVVGETARWLGIAISGLINALNPAVIVLGGPTADWGEVLIEAVRREIGTRTLPLSRTAVQIVTGQARALAPQLGAAVLVLQGAADLMAAPTPNEQFDSVA
jgi:predicted NBD/HSP70 family sugar kinase